MKSGRVAYESATDDEALDALAECAKYEGILPAIESAHAFFGARRYAKAHPGAHILIGCSGRGDKDMPILQRHLAQGSLTDEGRARDRAARYHFRGDSGGVDARAARRWWDF